MKRSNGHQKDPIGSDITIAHLGANTEGVKDGTQKDPRRVSRVRCRCCPRLIRVSIIF